MSNNTIYADDYSHISDEIWNNGYIIDQKTGFAKGEPYGFFNLPLSQKYGRTVDGPMSESALYPTDEDNVCGTNPCGEISLASYECCNLSELYLNNINSQEELIDCAKLLYKTQKAIAALPFIHEETNKIVHKNMRLGLGVTGVCQALNKLDWLDGCYKELRKFDKDWSKQRGWNRSIKLTTVKPSGTLSLLAGSTPGVHPAYSKYYTRRVRMASSDALVKFCRDLGYHVEYTVNFDGSENRDTVVVEFPCETPDGALFADDMGVIQQLEMVKKLQEVWADNAVSVTAYYAEEELPELKAWLKEYYKTCVKSVSFLLRQNHGFKQAPYEEISKEAYEKARAGVKPLKNVEASDLGSAALDGLECEGGACPVK
jgi:ribonucleotide reductase alpha subunit